MEDLIKNSDIIMKQLDDMIINKKKRKKRDDVKKGNTEASSISYHINLSSEEKLENSSISMVASHNNNISTEALNGLKGDLVDSIQCIFDRHSDVQWIDDVFNL